MKKQAIRTAKPAKAIEDPEMEAQKEREEAFSAEEPEWGGRPLEPYTSSRETLFVQLRTAAGAIPLREAIESTDAFFPDAIRILYLCTHTPEDWRPHRRDALAWQEHIEDWGDAAVPLNRKAEAAAVAMAAMSRGYVNEHVPVSRHGKTPSAKK